MRFTVHGSRFTVCVNKKTVNYELSPIRQAQAFGSEAQARRGDPEYIEGSIVPKERPDLPSQKRACRKHQCLIKPSLNSVSRI